MRRGQLGLVAEELPRLEDDHRAHTLDRQILQVPLVPAVHPRRRHAALRAGALRSVTANLDAVPSRGDVDPLAQPQARIGEGERVTLPIMQPVITVSYEICHAHAGNDVVSWGQVITNAQD